MSQTFANQSQDSRDEYGNCRSRQELSNKYVLAKIGVDTAENEPLKVWRKIQFIIHSPPYCRLLRSNYTRLHPARHQLPGKSFQVQQTLECSHSFTKSAAKADSLSRLPTSVPGADAGVEGAEGAGDDDVHEPRRPAVHESSLTFRP